ncbi:MAG: PQQ-like beta-propeller repeat protein [Myxococcaceae bacterium]|nr:PQQ-like beta-propeller repeat protein [Myxococcaceae bacterium]
MNARRLLQLAAVLVAGSAAAAQFNITLTNTSPTYPWSIGLLTLQPLIALGPTPQPGTPQYATYAFLNSNCDYSDAICPGTCTSSGGNTTCTGACNDNGNASVLINRWSPTLQLGVNAWLVPAVAANGGTQTVTIDAPAGSRLSYIAWVNDTSVFDDFVALHPTGDTSTLSVPLYQADGVTPLSAVDFTINGYDSNSTSPTDGSGTTCNPACPTASTGCYVALGNASTNSTGTFPALPPANVRNLTVVAGNGQNILTWTNGAPQSGVVVVRKSGSAVNRAPTNGTAYSAGASLGSRNTVVFANNGGTTPSTFTDTGLTNGTKYFYKVFSHNQLNYADGAVPTSAGVFGTPTPKSGANNPLWCYTFGLPSLQQPTTELNSTVFTASNSGALTASRTTVGTPATDGTERWRPTTMLGAIQSRPTLVPLQGRSGNWLITADQTGHAYLVSASTGALAWTAGNGTQLGTTIQAQPVVQLFAYANAAFQAAHPNRDVIFVATNNTGSTTNNKVYGISSVDGSILWTYSPGNMDVVPGGMAVDYTNNRLWVAGKSNGGTGQPSVRVLNTLNGAQLATFSVGDINYGVNLRFLSAGNEAVVVNSTGTVYGYNLASMSQVWSQSIGATSSWVYPITTGFIAPLSGASGTVRRYNVSGTSATQMWTTTTIANPTGVTIDFTNQKAFVGSSDGSLRQINLATGAIEKTAAVGGGALSPPTVDATASRLHVGTNDGRLCSFPVPLP